MKIREQAETFHANEVYKLAVVVFILISQFSKYTLYTHIFYMKMNQLNIVFHLM